MTKVRFSGLAPSEFIERVGAIKLELYCLKYKSLREAQLILEPGREAELFTATIAGSFTSGGEKIVSRSATNLYLSVILVGEAFESYLENQFSQPENVYDERL